MAVLVWAMIGIALWHFTIFLPDHFWSGIVGAIAGMAIVHVIGLRFPNPPRASRGTPNPRPLLIVATQQAKVTVSLAAARAVPT